MALQQAYQRYQTRIQTYEGAVCMWHPDSEDFHTFRQMASFELALIAHQDKQLSTSIIIKKE